MHPKGNEYKAWVKAQAKRRAAIKRMALKGVSYSEIARSHGISRQRARELALA